MNTGPLSVTILQSLPHCSMCLPELSTKSSKYMDVNGVIHARMDFVHWTDGC